MSKTIGERKMMRMMIIVRIMMMMVTWRRIGEEKENEIEESENDKGKESKWNRKRMINRRKGG